MHVINRRKHQNLIKSILFQNQNDVSHACFYFVDHEQTEITQTEKTADLMANTGGVLGLFLELSFLSLYRFILFVVDLIFL